MRLRLVTQTLLVAILLHALAALVFGDLRFSSFLQGAHRGLVRMPVSRSAMQASDAARLQQTSFARGAFRKRFPQNRDVFLRLHLPENRGNPPGAVDDEGAPFSTHVFLSVHAFLHPDAVGTRRFSCRHRTETETEADIS